jgi:hypothetical protein
VRVKVWLEKLKGRVHSKDLDIDGMLSKSSRGGLDAYG